jgi:Glyoxalase-like domain
VELDHILLAVSDLDGAAEHLEREYGLTSYVGGNHPRWGTGNRIVPLGDSYLELIAVVDERTAAGTDVGRWVANGASTTGAPIGWAVRPDDLDATVERLGITAFEGSRDRPDGTTLRWRMAGIDRAFDEPELPWFIDWEDRGTYPGEANTPVDARVVRIELHGNRAVLDAWLGPHALPLDVRDGTAGIVAVELDGPRGTPTLRRGD